MTDTAQAAGDATSVSDPADVETTPVGGQSDGAQASDPGDGRADESSANANPDPDNSESASENDDDALLKALATGKTDDLDENGERKKPSEPEKSDEHEPEKPQDKAEKAPDADGLSEDDRKELDDLKPRSNRERHKFAKLLKERAEGRQAKGFADALIADAKSAGLESVKDIQAIFHEERFLKDKSPEEVAAYYRKMADEIAPQVKPVEPAKKAAIDADLRAGIDAGYYSEEEAQFLADKREAAKNPQTKAPVEKPPEPSKPAGPDPEAMRKGYADIAEVSKGYKARFGAEWETISQDVLTKLGPLLSKADPATWPELATMAIEANIAKRQPPQTKKPPMTTRPSSPPPKKSTVMSEEEELDALAKGKDLT